jgi:hypothetical protein
LKNARDAVLARRASLKTTERSIGTSTAAGKCFLDMLGAFAEFETTCAASAGSRESRKPSYKGWAASIDATQVRAMKAQGLGPLRSRTRLSSV